MSACEDIRVVVSGNGADEIKRIGELPIFSVTNDGKQVKVEGDGDNLVLTVGDQSRAFSAQLGYGTSVNEVWAIIHG